MRKFITADDLEWQPSYLCDHAHIEDYRVVRLPHETYVIYQIDNNGQPLTRVGIFYNLNEVIMILRHDLKRR